MILDPALAAALSAAFRAQPQTPTSEGDLARAALAFLSEDPNFAEPIRVMASSPNRPQRFFEPSTIALTTAVLLALQTRIKFKRDQSGKWSLEIDKKSSVDAILKQVAQRLLPFLSK